VQPAGTLKSLRRYPVKSMAGEDLAEARVSFAGLAGDRVYAFIDNQNRSNFPWMTARQAHDMLLFRPRFLHPDAVGEEIPDPARYQVEVISPEGKTFRLPGDELEPFLETRYNRDLRLRFSERSMTDARPVSLFSFATLRALAEEAGVAIDARQFRANFYVQWQEDRPYWEDELVGREIQIGETVAVQIVKKDGRCVMINLNPETAAATPEVLNIVAREHGGYVGVYGAVLREGIVRSGDPVYLL
jgi:uncharacterized protein YcbX